MWWRNGVYAAILKHHFKQVKLTTNAKFLTMSHCETLPYFSKSSCKAPRLHWSGRFPTYNFTSFSTSSCWLLLLSVPSPLASDVAMSAVSVFSSFWFLTSARLSWLTSSLAILKSWTAPTRRERMEGNKMAAAEEAYPTVSAFIWRTQRDWVQLYKEPLVDPWCSFVQLISKKAEYWK